MPACVALATGFTSSLGIERCKHNAADLAAGEILDYLDLLIAIMLAQRPSVIQGVRLMGAYDQSHEAFRGFSKRGQPLTG